MNGAAVIQPAPIPFYTVLVLYLGIMAFIGWYAGRKTNNIGDFFVLSGKAGVVVSGIAYFSTQFSMGTFLGTPGTIYGVGYAGMAISVPGAVFCMILPALLIGRKLITLGHKYGFLTMADYLTDRYHSKNMSGVLGVMMLFFLVPMMGAQIIGAGVIVHVFTGLPEWVGVVGSGYHCHSLLYDWWYERCHDDRRYPGVSDDCYCSGYIYCICSNGWRFLQY